jgi:repressor LexA
VPAGPPDEVLSDGRRSVHKVLHHLAKGNRYVIRVRGDSMSPRIEDGDLLLVDYAKQLQPNDVVIAMHNGKAMVKKFIQKNGQTLLRSTNAAYKDIPVLEGDELHIAGVVLKIVEGDL